MPRDHLPPWVVLHVPHDATIIPADVRDQFLLDDVTLADEICRMTDHLTHALFATDAGDAPIVRAPVSRLVVDVERFACDADEPMAERGMGAVYRATSGLAPLRRALSADERECLMQAWYHPHHARLEAVVSAVLARHGHCLVLDCHSFPSVPLPYEGRDPGRARPDLCIGTDAFHTDPLLRDALLAEFLREGWTVAIDDPFAGALVPASRYGRDPRVGAIMVEVNRGLYLDEMTAKPAPAFDEVGRRIRDCCARAIHAASRGAGG